MIRQVLRRGTTIVKYYPYVVPTCGITTHWLGKKPSAPFVAPGTYSSGIFFFFFLHNNNERHDDRGEWGFTALLLSRPLSLPLSLPPPGGGGRKRGKGRKSPWILIGTAGESLKGKGRSTFHSQLDLPAIKKNPHQPPSLLINDCRNVYVFNRGGPDRSLLLNFFFFFSSFVPGSSEQTKKQKQKKKQKKNKKDFLHAKK